MLVVAELTFRRHSRVRGCSAGRAELFEGSLESDRFA